MDSALSGQQSHQTIPPQPLGGFAESVITEANKRDFDAVEVHPVMSWQDPDDSSSYLCEVCDPVTDEPSFWSAYVHLVEGGVDCIGDFATEQQAIDYAIEIAEKFGLRQDMI